MNFRPKKIESISRKVRGLKSITTLNLSKNWVVIRSSSNYWRTRQNVEIQFDGARGREISSLTREKHAGILTVEGEQYNLQFSRNFGFLCPNVTLQLSCGEVNLYFERVWFCLNSKWFLKFLDAQPIELHSGNFTNALGPRTVEDSQLYKRLDSKYEKLVEALIIGIACLVF